MIKHFRDWKVRNKLIFAFGTIIAMLIIVSAYVIISTEHMIKQTRELEIREFQGMSLSTEMRSTALKLAVIFANVEKDKVMHVMEEALTQRNKFLIHVEEFEMIAGEDKHTLDRIREVAVEFNEYYILGQKMADFAAAGDKPNLHKAKRLFQDATQVIEDLFYEFQDEDMIKMSLGLGGIDTAARNLQKACIALLIAALIFSIIITILLTKTINTSLLQLVKGTREIAAGFFGYKAAIPAKDELGEVLKEFNAMSEKLFTITASKQELELEVNERKAAEMKLKEYTHKIEEVNRELDSFTYIISHDLKEPLRSIDAFSKFVIDDYQDKIDKEGLQYLNRVRVNAKKMQELIEDLLELSRIERKRNPFSEISISSIIEDVKLRLEYSLEEKRAEIVIKDALPAVFCDKVRLTEVFANLISNAIKFIDKKDPRIEIGYAEGKTHHKFYIKDNGIGIEEKYCNKIFDIFQRLNKKEDYEGTGAGLAIVKKIIGMHHGEVWVESKVGEGSTFCFTILKDKDVLLSRRKLGEILIDEKLVTDEQIQQALDEQKKGGFQGQTNKQA